MWPKNSFQLYGLISFFGRDVPTKSCNLFEHRETIHFGKVIFGIKKCEVMFIKHFRRLSMAPSCENVFFQ